jgi:membrane protein DedA with SNARE-associated domain/rhodanese-related sulfurtransferase
MPLPLSVVLLTAGAAAHGGSLNLGLVILCAWSAALAGDLLMYFGGRRTGWWLLTQICRFSMNQEACVFGSAQQFYKRGPRALLIAKFVPGLASVSAVLAGSLSMRPRRFILLDGLGILTYVTSWSVAGYVFASFLRLVLAWLGRVAYVTEAMAATIVLVYLLWVIASLLRESRLPRVEKIAAKDLYDHLLTANSDRLLIIADVRSRGYYDPGMHRIKNSIRVDPGRLREDLEVLQEFMLPQPDCEIYLSCSCAHEATSMRVARMLEQQNCTTKVIRGGLKAWVKAGGPVEPVPRDDVEQLPRFQ